MSPQSPCPVLPALAGVLVLVLAGCTGLSTGSAPADTPGVATVVFRPVAGSPSSLQVMQFDPQGCQQASGAVPHDGDGTPLRLRPAQERFFALRADRGPDVCSVVVSFTPEPGARYAVVELKDDPNGVLGTQPCGVRIERVDGQAAASGIDATPWTMRRSGPSCVRPVESTGAAVTLPK